MIATEKDREVAVEESEQTPFEAQRRDVLQLLRDYRTFWTPYGGSVAAEDSHLKSADYGPAGLTVAGAYFDRIYVRGLRESYALLDDALVRLSCEYFRGRMSLVSPYLGSEADPSIAARWRETKELYVSSRVFIERHDRAIDLLTGYLEGEELSPVHPDVMSDEEEKELEYENAAIYAAFQRLRASGTSERDAMEIVGIKRGVPVSDVERIVEFRRGTETQCCEPGCERLAARGGLCSGHYQKWRRRERKRLAKNRGE